MIVSRVSDIPLPTRVAAACWTLHYVKRLYETVFVHRFSHSTMPIMNLFKNCSYYWGFAFYIGYFVNHPLYTEPYFGKLQVHLALISFLVSAPPVRTSDLNCLLRLAQRVRQLLDPHCAAQPSTSGNDRAKDPDADQEPVHFPLQLCVLPELCLRVVLVGLLHHPDPVLARY